MEALENPADAEVIFALSGDVEGESTAFYLYRKLSHTGVRFSTLARGLGFGDDLEYADELTLGRSAPWTRTGSSSPSRWRSAPA